MLNIINLQDFLFEKSPSRMDLFSYRSSCENPKFKIFVCRNHSFELIGNTIGAYLDFARLCADFEYSDYDDSLSFLSVNPEADLIILWLDLSRYNSDEVHEFIKSRIQYLKTVFKKPIIFAPISGGIKIDEVGVLNLDFAEVEKELGEKFFDLRMSQHTGTNLSAQACLKISKELGLKYIPSVLLPNIKAIALDLDNTLYQGVLGEDGIEGIKLTQGHLELQKTVKRLTELGFFVCVVSKNKLSDVEELFEKRSDFPLKLDDFTKIYASWQQKCVSIEAMAKDLNIHHDSILFVDDNVGEISSALTNMPQIKFILAKEDAGITNEILKNYPRLYKSKASFEDVIRSRDFQANEERKSAQLAMSPQDYLNSLEVELGFSIDDPSQVERICELANKTNQFIFSYKRYSKIQMQELIKDRNYYVVTVSLKDKLSDSGIVGVLVAKKEGNVAIVEELFVSCRALGRGLDETMVFGAIELCLKTLVCDKLKVDFVKGERNEPAYNFAQKNLAKYLNKADCYDSFKEKMRIKEIITNGY